MGGYWGVLYIVGGWMYGLWCVLVLINPSSTSDIRGLSWPNGTSLGASGMTVYR
jgi:hypothetical protein